MGNPSSHEHFDDMGQVVDDVVELGALAMEFAETYRVTRLPSGEFESDTDHTVMLGLIACSWAAKYYPNLDLGKVAQYAMIHDLVEVIAKDTPTIDISDEDLAAKQQREAEALETIKAKFGEVFPWIHQTIETYEKLADPEARFVKTLDKIVPAITHLFNNGAYLLAIGLDNKDLRQAALDTQAQRMLEYSYEFPELMALREQLESRVTHVLK